MQTPTDRFGQLLLFSTNSKWGGSPKPRFFSCSLSFWPYLWQYSSHCKIYKIVAQAQRKISKPLPPEFYKPLSSHQALAEIPATSHLENYICCSALSMQSRLSLSLWLRGGSNNEIIRSGEISRSKHRNQREASFDLSTHLHVTKW